MMPTLLDLDIRLTYRLVSHVLGNSSATLKLFGYLSHSGSSPIDASL